MDGPETIQLTDVSNLSETGVLPVSKVGKAISLIRHHPYWEEWWLKALFAFGVGHLLAGIVFFFAFNWNDLAASTKFLIVQGGLVLTIGAWILTKLDKASQAFGIAATILVGVMLAVYGQVYQTPASIYVVFICWAILTIPFVLASKSHAHWAVWIVIVYVAISSYVNMGLRPVRGDLAANAFNLFSGVSIFFGLAIYNRFWTDKGRGVLWFRMFLLAVGLVFCIVAFSEGLWARDNHAIIWVAALLIVGGLIAYLYKLRGSIPALAMASFAVVAMLAQMVFEFVDDFDGNSFVLTAFFVMIWFIILTLGLAWSFRHFFQKFKTDPRQATDSHTSTEIAATIGVAKFSEELQIKPDLLSDDDKTPWYMEMFLGFCGVFTAVIAGIFVGSLLSITFGVENEVFLMIVGLVVLVVSLMLRRGSSGIYLRHLLNTFVMAGGALALVGLGILVDFSALVSLIGLALCLTVMFLLKDRLIAFLLGLTIAVFIAHFIHEIGVKDRGLISSIICVGLGVALLTIPIKKRLYIGAGSALIIAAPLRFLVLENLSGTKWEMSFSWNLVIMKFILIAVMLAAIFFINYRLELKGKNRRPQIWITLLLALAAVVLPMGSAFAILVIIVGFIIGSRAIALVGVLIQIYFLWMFYYELQMTLLSKSIVLIISGLGLLGLWFFSRRILNPSNRALS